MTERDIFIAALQQDPAQRQAYLDEACAGQPELRKPVEDLLRLYEGAGSFLQKPAAESAATGAFQNAAEKVSSPEGPGAVIGPYKLLQQIGEGGMGVVYMAEQTKPVQRKVALKVIKPGMDSRQIIARFEAERQALAMMDHVNIARVLDAGTTGGVRGWGLGVSEDPRDPPALTPNPQPLTPSSSGRPYFVMELVHGVPITKYCDDNHLTPRERLELFVPVCQAIQHAHQKGIIHRDIKPSNVMVTLYDGKPVPKVIDFGVAKATEQKLTERTLFTQFGTMIGTLEYMSPEQAEMSALGIDTRSDIYSLGVLLYELLTGSTPLSSKRMKEAAYAEILRMIKEEEPPKPSTRLSDSGEALASISAQRHTEPAKLSKLMRGELDWIVMKTLEKDRNRRYETASGFAADVQRYLDDEPVQACPPSAGYRFRKFARRNRAAVLTAAAVLFVLVAGIAGTTFGLFRAEHRRAEAEQARADEAAQRQIADAEKKKAEQAESDTLADYRASTDDAIEQLIGSKPDLGPQEKAYLEKTLKRWQAFAARQGNDERSQAIRAEGHHRVGLLWANLGQSDAARTECETARDLYKKLAADFPAVPGYQHELARTHHNLGNVLMKLGQREAARTEYETARDLQKKLAAAFPAVPEYQQKLAIVHNSLGNLLRDLGQGDAARTEYETAHDLRKKLAAAFPAVPTYQEELARTHVSLGALLASRGQRDAARTEYQTARDLQKKLADAFPAVPTYQVALAATHIRLGNLLFELGQRDAARMEFETARDLEKRLADAFPAVPDYQEQLATTHNNLGGVLLELGSREAAQTQYETARDLQKRLADAFPAVPDYQEQLARTHNNLGILLMDLGQRDAARTEYETARDLKKKLADAFPAVPEYQVDLGGSYNDLGTLVRDEGRPADSLHWYDLAIRTLTPVYEKDPRAVRARQFLRGSHGQRATAYHDLKQYAEEVKDWEKAIEIDPKYVDGHRNLGVAFYQQGKPEKAIAAYQVAIKLNPKDAMAYSNLALALVELRDPEKLPEAVAAAEKAIELDPKSASAHNILGLALSDQKKLDASAAAHQKAIDLDPKHADAHANLGTNLARQKKYDLAIACCRKALEINPKIISAYSTLGIALRRQKKLDEAIAEFRKALVIKPKDVNILINLGNALREKGWELANHPDPKLRDPKRAVEAGKEAVELAPQSVDAWQYLGWVQYRAGNWQASLEALAKSCELQKGGDAGQWIVLVLAHAKLAAQEGLSDKEREHHEAEARRRYEQADKWMARWPVRPGDEIGQAVWDFHLEARELLGAKETKK